MTEVKLDSRTYGVHDTFRKGFSHALKDTIAHHPLEMSEKNHEVNSVKKEMKSARCTHGIHMAVKLNMERSIVSRVHRLPGLPSSNLGLRTLTGTNDYVGPEDIFNDIPEDMINYSI